VRAEGGEGRAAGRIQLLHVSGALEHRLSRPRGRHRVEGAGDLEGLRPPIRIVAVEQVPPSVAREEARVQNLDETGAAERVAAVTDRELPRGAEEVRVPQGDPAARL